MKLKYQGVNKELNVIKPIKMTSGASGFDVSYNAFEDSVVLKPHKTYVLNTNLKFQIPEDHEIQVRGRSGLARKGLLVHFGTIDSDYTGELGIIMTNLSSDEFVVYRGDRIAQIVVVTLPTITELVLGTVSDNSDRGNKGFGSTGL